MTAPEIRYFEQLEESCDDGIPEWVDEDAHLHDYDYDELQAMIETHNCEDEYIAHLISTGDA